MSNEVSKAFNIGTSQRPSLDLPPEYAYYILKYSSPQVYQKLILLNSWFFVSGKAVVVENFALFHFDPKASNWLKAFRENQFLLTSKNKQLSIDLKLKKLWLIGKFQIGISSDQSLVSKILNSTYRCHITNLLINYQNLTVHEFLTLSKTSKNISLRSTKIFLDTGEELKNVHDILKLIPEVEEFSYFSENAIFFCPDLKLTKIKKLELGVLDESFDQFLFLNFAKEHEDMTVSLVFQESTSCDFFESFRKAMKNSDIYKLAIKLTILSSDGQTWMV